LGARLVRDVAVVVLVHLAVASVIGFLLPHLADLAEVTRAADGVTTSEVEVAKRFNDDGWLVVTTGVAGLVLGLLLQLWRSTNDVVTILALALTALLASLLAGWIAEATGPGDPVAALAEARRGATASVPVTIDSRVAYLVWPLTTVMGALVVLVAPPTRPSGNHPDPHDVQATH
jgi:hypothetical protein